MEEINQMSEEVYGGGLMLCVSLIRVDHQVVLLPIRKRGLKYSNKKRVKQTLTPLLNYCSKISVHASRLISQKILGRLLNRCFTSNSLEKLR